MRLLSLLHLHALISSLLVTPVSRADTASRSISSRFDKLTGRHFTCDIPLQPLYVRALSSLLCARACLELKDCNSFVITTGIQGSCTYCPAENITALEFVPTGEQTDSWVHRKILLANPLSGKSYPIPGIGTFGTLVAVKGRVPIPLPSKFFVDFKNKTTKNTIFRFVRYSVANPSYIRLNAIIDSTYLTNKGDNIVNPVPTLFPFAEGEPYEINILITRYGFVVYVEGIYVYTYNVTISYAADIDFVVYQFESEVYEISF
ncbi:hypothetical protein RRG08_028173 [Elysia crispata]|uniref:Galectin n=1 Tax=Elysia crispata TaxID=231223 RepID=A0AAE0Z5T0_9GAST|nr:hypothetical protein RRG08_028173 [Elysia crispata]